MTAKMIRYDDEYAPLLDELVAKSNGHIEVVNDPNLEYDPYFYERKDSLNKTIKAVDDGTMKMYNQEEWKDEMLQWDKELEKKYGNN